MAGGSSSVGGSAHQFAERLIEAYTQRYREAGRWKALSWVGSAALFVSGLVLAAVGDGAAILGLVASGYLLCSRLILRPEMTRAHRDGVVLQELYDTYLFSLPWNTGLAGKEPALVDVEDLAARLRGGADGLADWYVDCGGAPQGAQVLMRQLENATWGRLDHRRFAIFALVTLVLSAAATVAVGLVEDLSLAAYVSTLAAPALPWLLDLADLSALHWRAARSRGEIEAEAAALWAALPADGAVKATELRVLQDRIFGVRRSSGRVPTWFYARYRKRNHAAFGAAAERMLEERGWLGGG